MPLGEKSKHRKVFRKVLLVSYSVTAPHCEKGRAL